jgi:uncharacterized protein YlxW (UPF0749 family)
VTPEQMPEQAPQQAPERPPGPADSLPPQVTMGLLDYLASTALDEDYAVVAARRATQCGAGGDAARGGSRRARIATAAVLGLFALLLAVAAVQSAQNQPVREAGRESLVDEVSDRRQRLTDARAEVGALRREVADLRSSQLESTQQGRALQDRLRTLGAAVGAGPVAGPGMVVTVDDAPDATSDRDRVLDTDLQRLVNGLWQAGAEAISINGQRLTQLTAVRTAGEAIHVNFKPLRRPYVVSAIGNPDQLPARFVESRGGAWWLNLRSVYNVRFEMNSRQELTLPAVRINDLRVARATESAS